MHRQMCCAALCLVAQDREPITDPFSRFSPLVAIAVGEMAYSVSTSNEGHSVAKYINMHAMRT